MERCFKATKPDHVIDWAIYARRRYATWGFVYTGQISSLLPAAMVNRQRARSALLFNVILVVSLVSASGLLARPVLGSLGDYGVSFARKWLPTERLEGLKYQAEKMATWLKNKATPFIVRRGSGISVGTALRLTSASVIQDRRQDSCVVEWLSTL